MWVLYAIILAAPFSENVVWHGKYTQTFRTQEECREAGATLTQELVDAYQQSTHIPIRGLFRCVKEGEET